MELLAAAGADDPAGTLRPLLDRRPRQRARAGRRRADRPDRPRRRQHRPRPPRRHRRQRAADAAVVRRPGPRHPRPRRHRRPAAADPRRRDPAGRSTRPCAAGARRRAPADLPAVSATPRPRAHPRGARRAAGPGPRRRPAGSAGADHGRAARGPRQPDARSPASASATGRVVVSIFVNPLQFGAGEDLDRYPRTLDADLEVCEREGVDVVFAPARRRGLPRRRARRSPSSPARSATVLEGRTRPGHFRGVLTVVAKLFGLVRPDVAVFGQKDYQQLVLIRRMVLDLNLAVEVVGAETVREADGLALSSRNRYLDAEQRQQAAALQPHPARRPGGRAVRRRRRARRGAGRAARGRRGRPRLPRDHRPRPRRAARRRTRRAPRPGSSIAARVGTTRLIDNLPSPSGPRPSPPEGAS